MQYLCLDSLISEISFYKVIVVSCLEIPGQVFFRQDLNMHLKYLADSSDPS